MVEKDHTKTFYLLTASFFIVVFIEIPLLIAYGIVSMLDWGLEWIPIFYMGVFCMESFILILSAIRDKGEMSKKA